MNKTTTNREDGKTEMAVSDMESWENISSPPLASPKSLSAALHWMRLPS